MEFRELSLADSYNLSANLKEYDYDAMQLMDKPSKPFSKLQHCQQYPSLAVIYAHSLSLVVLALFN